MKNRLIAEITRKMLPCLDNAQMEQLQDVLQHCLWGIQIAENPDAAAQQEKESSICSFRQNEWKDVVTKHSTTMKTPSEGCSQL